MDEAMAIVKWDFPHIAFPETRIKGQSTIRRLSDAQKIARIMNMEYGDGSHWIEPQNQTYDELTGART